MLAMLPDKQTDSQTDRTKALCLQPQHVRQTHKTSISGLQEFNSSKYLRLKIKLLLEQN